MDGTIRQILRHGTVFGIGAVLSRLASVVLLPVYMRYLAPSDYGVIALIDITVNLLAIAAGGGIAAAAMREHAADESDEQRDRIWWTALIAVAALATAVFGMAFLSRQTLANMLLGDEVPRGAYYFGLAMATVWLGTMTVVIELYFTAAKASVWLVSVSTSRLLLNVALNITFVVFLGLGVEGVLWGNAVAAAAVMAVQFAVFSRQRRRVIVDRGLIARYWTFGWPLIIYGVLAAVMHEADRYVLRLFVPLADIGLYSVAYQIAQGVNALIISPFSAIWGVLLYEIARQPAAEQTYARVFKLYVFGLALVLLLASLFAGPVLALIASPAYAPAARIVPVICLAYLLFSVHEHFKVPALVSGKTLTMLPVIATAAAANVVLNLQLIPVFGVMAAAWASVLTFLIFSGGGLLRYRRIAKYPYPLRTCLVVVVGMIGTYWLHHVVSSRMDSIVFETGLALVLWCGWTVALFGPVVRRAFPQREAWRVALGRFAIKQT